MRRFCAIAVLATAFVWAGCSDQPNPVSPDAGADGIETNTVTAAKKGKKGKTGGADIDSRMLRDAIERVNARLEAEGAPYRVDRAEWIAAPGAERQGTTVFFDDRGNKQLDAHFLPGDPRRGGRTDITYLVDQSDGATASGLTAAQTGGAIDRAMTTWEDDTRCSGFEITKVADTGADPDLIDSLLGAGPPGVPLSADIVHGGWLPAEVLGPSTLGVTFTLTFVEDLNQDGQAEVAWREIYYNDAFSWGIDVELPLVDVESIALHEAGHGLSQAHFGKLFRTNANGKLHFAPFALMNAGFTQTVQELQSTDRAGHCSIWSSWPDN